MKDEFSGSFDLERLFDHGNPQSKADGMQLNAAVHAEAGDIDCVFVGMPELAGAGNSHGVGGIAQAQALIHAWRLHGVELPAKLRGTYALAIVDRAQKRILLAVDRFAVRTVCYRLDRQSFSFSERADTVAGRSLSLNPQAVFDYLYFHAIPAPRTIFSDVLRLPAGHSLIVDTQGAKLVRHWTPQFDERRYRDFDGAKEQLRSLIRKAVADAASGQHKTGAFLSGGTDSSTVAGMLCSVTGQSAPAYSIGFEAEGYDEMEYARLSARHFGCDHNEYYVTPDDLIRSIPAIAQHYDQPFGNSSALPAYYCAKMAREDGCTLLLAGDGGDELFGGNSRYAVQKFLQYYQSVPQGIRRIIEPFCTDDSFLRRIPGLRQATGYVRHSRDPLPHRLQKMNLLMQLGPGNIFTSALLSKMEPGAPGRHMQATWDSCEADSVVNRMLAYDWRYTLADSDLPKVRGATDMAGIAVSYPLLADDLVDFSMGLPRDWKLKGFRLRWFFKEALRGFLPDAVISKKKQGFGLPHGQWMTRHPRLLAIARDSLHGLAGRGVVNAGFVGDLLDRRLQEHPPYYGEMIWILMALEQWLRGQPGVTLDC